MKIALVGETVKVPLSGGTAFALISQEDADKVLQWSWYVQVGPWTSYAKSDGPGKSTYMHRYILDLRNGYYVDHIDRNGLNNQRSNIRVLSPSDNARRSNKPVGKIPYRGVYASRNKFVAALTVDYKRHYLGSFATPEEAYFAYQSKVKEMGLIHD